MNDKPTKYQVERHSARGWIKVGTYDTQQQAETAKAAKQEKLPGNIFQVTPKDD